MREILKSKLAGLKTADEKYNFLREFLQEFILQTLDRHEYFRHLAFVGGTALRIIHDLPRFSEDLDFSLIKKETFDFNKMLQAVKKESALNGLEIEMKESSLRTVYSAFIKFKEILFELGLTNHKTEKLFVKLEIDSNPPQGYKTEISLINKNFLFKVVHYDLASLFAGKLHAFLFRKYAKARDYYDLLWFLTRKTAVNYRLLNAAAAQTQKKVFKLNSKELQDLLIEKINHVNFKHLREEILPFLVNRHEAEYFDAANFTTAIKKGLSCTK